MTGEDRLDGTQEVARQTAYAAVGRGVRKEAADDGSAAPRVVGVGGVLLTFPTIKERKVVGIKPLPCCGEGCLDATRDLFEEALRHGAVVASG